MIEPPLERLNYYNGQRLEAGDLKLEQEYHIRTRRWLNKSLYTTGIASGLEVRAEKGTRTVIVSPGLALDGEGREILLLEEARLTVPGKPHKKAQGSDATVEGLYLTIRYNEESIHEERNGCVPQSEGSKQNGNRPAWGGPARVQAKPQFNWRDSLPYESSGEVLLAQVELTPDCSQVHQVNTGVRRYVGAASDAKVRQYALEGERHIDKDNPGKIYFHVRGRQPKSVTLYLRAEQFSTLYYTEQGNHTHGLDVKGTIGSPTPSLFTDVEMTSPTDPSPHTHTDLQASYFGDDGRPINCFLVLGVWPALGPASVELPFIGTVGHGNLLAKVSNGTWTDSNGNNHSKPPFNAVIQGATQHIHMYQHSHAFTFDSNASKIISAGVADTAPQYTARSGPTAKPLTFANDLKIKIDSRPVTTDIVAQLKAADPTWNTNSQDKLGNGLGNHPLVVDPVTRRGGTGEIKLDFLPNVFFLEGEHIIELSVEGEGNGGRIFYNLYVE